MGHMPYGAARERIAVPRRGSDSRCPTLSGSTARGGAVDRLWHDAARVRRSAGELRPGETLVVLGASGGVGLAAVEIGALMGARVIACASSEEKLAFARAHGAAEAIDYAAQRSARRIEAPRAGRRRRRL